MRGLFAAIERGLFVRNIQLLFKLDLNKYDFDKILLVIDEGRNINLINNHFREDTSIYISTKSKTKLSFLKMGKEVFHRDIVFN